MNRLLTTLAFSALLAGLCVPASSYPKPSINKLSWELDFQHGVPTRIMVKTPGSPAPRPYWYMTFTVTNNSGQEQDFLPEFDLVDVNGNVHRSDKAIPKEVFDLIKQNERSKHLEPLGKVTGRLLVGADQARDSVAIWPEPVERMGSFSIFISGLSGEAVWFKDGKELPMSQADWTKLKPAEAGQLLRKTLELDYQVPGDQNSPGRDPVILKQEQWVMR